MIARRISYIFTNKKAPFGVFLHVVLIKRGAARAPRSTIKVYLRCPRRVSPVGWSGTGGRDADLGEQREEGFLAQRLVVFGRDRQLLLQRRGALLGHVAERLGGLRDQRLDVADLDHAGRRVAVGDAVDLGGELVVLLTQLGQLLGQTVRSQLVVLDVARVFRDDTAGDVVLAGGGQRVQHDAQGVGGLDRGRRIAVQASLGGGAGVLIDETVDERGERDGDLRRDGSGLQQALELVRRGEQFQASVRHVGDELLLAALGGCVEHVDVGGRGGSGHCVSFRGARCAGRGETMSTPTEVPTQVLSYKLVWHPDVTGVSCEWIARRTRAYKSHSMSRDHISHLFNDRRGYCTSRMHRIIALI
jgi:hypothetical protein